MRAFSLIELLVVIAIISLLITIGVVAMNLAQDNALDRQTRQIMSTATMAQVEFAAAMDGPVNHNRSSGVSNDPSRDPIDWSDPYELNAPAFSGTDTQDTLNDNVGTEATTFVSIERFVAACYLVPAAREQLNVLNADGRLEDTDGDGFMEILDAWDVPLRYRDLGRNIPDDRDFGMPPHRDPYFGSAGPDGIFGAMHDDPTDYPDTGWGPQLDGSGDLTEDGGFAADNIFSFEVLD